jgi:hypothetical protein
LFIFLEAFKEPFVTAVEAASQSSSGTRANRHKVEAAEEGLLLGKSVEYTASQTHRPTLIPTTPFDSTVGNPSKAQIFTIEHLPQN